jgi:hypothetical protein
MVNAKKNLLKVSFLKSLLERGCWGMSGSRGVFLQAISKAHKHTPPPLSRGESHNPALFFL